MHGRRWSDGLHQAVEAKEGVKIQRESVTYATITLQNYFRLYKKLAGMTGTAWTERDEFHQIYGLDVIMIPTHQGHDPAGLLGRHLPVPRTASSGQPSSTRSRTRTPTAARSLSARSRSRHSEKLSEHAEDRFRLPSWRTAATTTRSAR